MSTNIQDRKNQTLIATLAMMVAVVLSNYLVQFEINAWLTWGAFSYPCTFFITELTNQIHGPKAARRVVYLGFFVALMISFVLFSPRIAIASTSAFLIGQLLDISIFTRLRKLQWWIAPASSSISASAIDTLVFFSIAFGPEKGGAWIYFALGDFLIKLLLDISLLFPFRTFLRTGFLGYSPSRS